MKTTFRYLLLLGVIIIPLFVLLDDEEKFPILFGAFSGVTITFWIAVWILAIKSKNKKSEE
ncbi:MAG: hypothetical protein FWC34_05850 [Bacteroidetes bacterium]|nr:hypothetical protein [Bacteroidota bacterium]MCL2301783.1 hypothetical protein [Lentimicrobiaceae bacterium]